MVSRGLWLMANKYPVKKQSPGKKALLNQNTAKNEFYKKEAQKNMILNNLATKEKNDFGNRPPIQSKNVAPLQTSKKIIYTGVAKGLCVARPSPNFLESTDSMLTCSTTTKYNSSMSTDLDVSTTEIFGSHEESCSSPGSSLQVHKPSSNDRFGLAASSKRVDKESNENSKKEFLPDKNNSNARHRRVVFKEGLKENSNNKLAAEDDILFLRHLMPVIEEEHNVEQHMKLSNKANTTTHNHLKSKSSESFKKYEASCLSAATDSHDRDNVRKKACLCCYGSMFPSSQCTVHGFSLFKQINQTRPLIAWDPLPADIIKQVVDDSFRYGQLNLCQRPKRHH